MNSYKRLLFNLLTKVHFAYFYTYLDKNNRGRGVRNEGKDKGFFGD